MGLGYRPLRLFLALFLFNAIFAVTVASQYSPIRIKVLTAEFHPIANSSPVPTNCDMQNFDAYCNESKNPTGENIMQVPVSYTHLDSKDSKSAASSTPAPNPKVTALLDVLVAKGILAPAEASAIRSAGPDAEVQLLIEALNRKGLLLSLIHI